MFRSPPTRALCAALVGALLACAHPDASVAPPPHTQWVEEDGSQPSAAEFDAAVAACDAQVNTEVELRGRRNRYVDWGVRMIACMEEQGLTRKPPPAGN